MPAYNAEKFIQKAIESILNQTFQDFELVVIDDCSNDNTIEIIKSFKTNKIRILQTHKQSGAAASRNLGITQAVGGYIAFLDADDWAYPDRLAKQIAFLEANKNIDLLGSWIEVVDIEGNKLPYVQTKIPAYHLPIKLLFHNCFALSSVMLRKQILVNFQFDTAFPLAQDYELWSRLSHTYQMDILPTILVKYLTHYEGISKQKPEIMIKMVSQIKHTLLGKLKINPTIREYELHEQIGHLTFEPSIQFFIQACQWLNKLHKANQSTSVYSSSHFDEVLLHYWKYICQSHFHQKGTYLLSIHFWYSFASSFYTRLWLNKKLPLLFRKNS